MDENRIYIIYLKSEGESGKEKVLALGNLGIIFCKKRESSQKGRILEMIF